jgi:hypothetical protein
MIEANSAPRVPRRAWNKGKLNGPKPPLRPSQVWAIRAKLDLEKRTRDLALFNLAIDSKLRDCDLVGELGCNQVRAVRRRWLKLQLKRTPEAIRPEVEAGFSIAEACLNQP